MQSFMLLSKSARFCPLSSGLSEHVGYNNNRWEILKQTLKTETLVYVDIYMKKRVVFIITKPIPKGTEVDKNTKLSK